MASPNFKWDSSENVVTVNVTMDDKTKTKPKPSDLLANIMIHICAFLNAVGMHTIVFNCQHLPTKDIDVFKTKIENKIKEDFGPDILLNYVRINDVFDEDHSKSTKFTCEVKPCSYFCSHKYNLYFPASTQVIKLKSQFIKHILPIINNPWQSPASELIIEDEQIYLEKGKKFQINESDVTQFKYFKQDEENKLTSDWLGDKIKECGFTHYISAFANYRGGHVYYGIEDKENKILGQKLKASDKVVLTNKISGVLKRMVWGKDPETKPKRGTDWEIQYIPVCDNNRTEIEDLFVIAVSVSSFPNGVFSQEPESYEWKDGKVIPIKYQDWRDRMQVSNECFHRYSTIIDRNSRKECFDIINEVDKVVDSSRSYTATVWLLSKCKEFGEDESQGNPIKPQLITCYLALAYLFYRHGDLVACNFRLQKANELLPSVKNRPILQLHYYCLQASLARKKGDLDKSLRLTYDCLAETDNILPGWENAIVWKTHGVTLAQMAVCEEDEYRRQKRLTKAEHAWHKAIEHAQKVVVTQSDGKSEPYAITKIINRSSHKLESGVVTSNDTSLLEV